MRLTLKPFGPVDSAVLSHLRSELHGFDEVVVASPSPLPAGGYDAVRRQYRASSLFAACQTEPGTRVLGVTEADLYDEDRTFVFGYAMIGDRPAVISLARLRKHGTAAREGSDPRKLGPRAERRFLDRCVKEAVHEIGHTLGLTHDDVHPDCVMHYSRTLRDTDRKGKAYCFSCATQVELTLTRLRT